MSTLRRSLAGACVLCLFILFGSPSSAQVADADWLTYNRTLPGDRFSPLKEINRSNVAQLKGICTYTLPEVSSLQTGPLVVDGTMCSSRLTKGPMQSMRARARRSGNSIGTAIRQACCS